MIGHTAYGRIQGAVDQSPGGDHYPFVEPSQSIEFLIDDLFFYFDEEACDARPPFAVTRLYGFGEGAADPASWEHEYDAIVSDRLGTVLFDTNASDVTFVSEPFGPDKQTLQWTDLANKRILRMVIWTSWGSSDTPIEWPEWFDVTNGQLAARAVQRRVPTIDQIRIVRDLSDMELDEVLSQGRVTFRPGYNYSLETTESESRYGRLQTVLFHSASGEGLGRYPGCEEDRFIRRIGGVESDSAGNFLLDSRGSGGGCLRVNLKQTEPSANTGIYSGNIRSVAVDPHTLLVDNDCGVCADCEDFIRVYEAIRRVLDKYTALGARAEAVRDQYQLNKTRWEANRACRFNTQLRIAIQPVAPCLLAVGIGVCNQTDENLTNFNLTLEFASSHADACLVCESTFRRGNVKAGDPPPTQSVRYKMGGDWPDYTASFDCISEGGLGYLGFYMRAESCDPGQTITVTVNGSNSSYTFPEASATATLIAAADTINCCELTTPTTTEAP